MDAMFTAAQMISACLICLAVGIVAGAIWVLHMTGGLLLPKGK